jgi:tripartite-type tricarboxylate transporter receptor subunit TctC
MEDKQGMNVKIILLTGTAVAAAVVGLTSWVYAQDPDFPKTHIKLILGFAPGTGSDILGRVLVDKLSRELPPGVVAENRPGAGGRIGTKQVVDAQPDGHTVVLGTNATLIVGPLLSANAPYRAERDLAPISMVGRTNMVLVVSAEKGPKTLDELVERLRKEHLTFASAGAGTMGHLSSELLLMAAKAKAGHVAYRGSSQSLTDVLRGEVAFAIDTAVAVLPFTQNGTLRALAVTGTDRLKTLPDIKTFGEQGMLGLEIYAWWAVLAPAATPAGVVKKLGDEIEKAVAAEDVRARMKTMEVEPLILRGENLRAFMVKETAFWENFVSKSGLRIN